MEKGLCEQCQGCVRRWRLGINIIAAVTMHQAPSRCAVCVSMTQTFMQLTSIDPSQREVCDRNALAVVLVCTVTDQALQLTDSKSTEIE